MINAHQTKEEEIGSLPEKEFRIMIVKMIQNLENKMELQLTSLETRVHHMFMFIKWQHIPHFEVEL